MHHWQFIKYLFFSTNSFFQILFYCALCQIKNIFLNIPFFLQKQRKSFSKGFNIFAGSHEANVYNSIPEEGIAQSELMKLPNAKVGFSKAMSNGWVLVDKTGTPALVKRKVPEIKDLVYNFYFIKNTCLWLFIFFFIFKSETD